MAIAPYISKKKKQKGSGIIYNKNAETASEREKRAPGRGLAGKFFPATVPQHHAMGTRQAGGMTVGKLKVWWVGGWGESFETKQHCVTRRLHLIMTYPDACKI